MVVLLNPPKANDDSLYNPPPPVNTEELLYQAGVALANSIAVQAVSEKSSEYISQKLEIENETISDLIGAGVGGAFTAGEIYLLKQIAPELVDKYGFSIVISSAAVIGLRLFRNLLKILDIKLPGLGDLNEMITEEEIRKFLQEEKEKEEESSKPLGELITQDELKEIQPVSLGEPVALGELITESEIKKLIG